MKPFNYRTLLFTAALLFTFGMNSSAMAEGVPWKDHQAPFDFLFGNHFDTHQQTKPMPDGSLSGYLYVKFTGDLTPDGVPVTRHADAGDPMNEVSVGWKIKAVPAAATVVYHQTGDHPIWLVDDRNDIPQPGGYSHFHWLDGPLNAMDLIIGETYEGYILELTAKDTFAFMHGSDKVYVTNGLDLATHTNIVTSFPGFTDGDQDGGNGGGH
ncbi:MAG: hypothetical protein RRA15_03310 [bacterium]|nr:hypothetical protein [bacterium]MDT8365502.1 hypothetical protein [bacterium]